MPKSVFIMERAPAESSRLARMILDRPDLSLAGSAADVATTLEACAVEEPDILVVDLSAEVGDGAGLIQHLRSAHRQLSILALSPTTEARAVEGLLRAGATGCVTPNGDHEELLRALDRVLDGELYLNERLAVALLERLLSGVSHGEEQRVDQLSDREREVFALLGEGWPSRDIAEHLGIAVKTVDTYRERIKEKLDLVDFRQLYHFAIRWAVRRAEDDLPR
jgi:DNA-binding NarL/FixJ family response regulator